MIRLVIKLYIYILIADAIISYIPQVSNQPWAKFIRKISNVTLDPIRRLLPADLPFDVSPIIVIVLLQIIMVLW